MRTRRLAADRAVLDRLARPGDARDQADAALVLCRQIRPVTIDALVVLLAPERDGRHDIRSDVFDALCDGLAAWRDEMARRAKASPRPDPA